MNIIYSFKKFAPYTRLILIVCFVFCSLHMGAFSRTYYFRATIQASPSGKGTVYMDTESHETDAEGIATGVTYVASTTKTYNKSVGTLNSSARQNVYIYAKATHGHLFSSWTVTGDAEVTSPDNNYTLVALTSTSTSSSSPATFTITANFVNDVGMVKAVSSNLKRGTVTISDAENEEGDVVTITATPLLKLKGVKFLYWEKTTDLNPTPVQVEGGAQMTVTATDDKTNYTAYFSEPTEEKGIYCRIKNRSTGNYLSFYGNTEGVYSTEGSGQSQRPVYTFNGLKMLTPAQAISNPSTIIMLSGADNNAQGLYNTDFEGQGVTFSTDMAKRSDTSAQWGEINTNATASGYRFVMQYTSSQSTFPLFLRDNGASGVRFGSNNDAASFWDIEPIDEVNINDYYIGVAPSQYFTKEDDLGNTKYYTTFYADFGYKLMDGMAAYYIEGESSIDGDIVHLTKIPTGSIVPARMGVILECSTYGDASQNRLVPVVAEPDNQIRLINGLLGLNGERPDPDDFPDVVVYVLSVNSNYQNMGFYRYHQPLAPNKAYVAVPVSEESRAQRAQFVWGGNQSESTNIDHLEFTTSGRQKIYDLTGREVSKPTHGIYIKGGKKFIVK